MCRIMKKLGEAELEIMQVVWNEDHPLTSNYILKQLQGRRKWKLSTLMTSLYLSSAILVSIFIPPMCSMYFKICGGEAVLFPLKKPS